MITIVKWMGTRTAIMTVPPNRVTVDPKDSTKLYVGDLAQVTPVLLPDDVSIRRSPWFLSHALATTIPRIIFLHETTPSQEWTLDTLLHELTHEVQARFLGRVKFFAKYLSLWVLYVLRYWGQWHLYHPMEVEARRVAAALCSRVNADNELEPIDAEPMITAYLRATPS